MEFTSDDVHMCSLTRSLARYAQTPQDGPSDDADAADVHGRPTIGLVLVCGFCLACTKDQLRFLASPLHVFLLAHNADMS